jgi:hypothetical protein
MAFKDIIHRLLKRDKARRPVEYVKATFREAPAEPVPPSESIQLQQALPAAEAHKEDDIAFSPQGDLEDYVRGLAVSQEAIERWISAGVLLPEETKVAAKMIRIMAKKNKQKMN